MDGKPSHRRQSLRVVISHALYPPDYAGGGEYVVHEIAKGLQHRGASVRVITTGDPAQNLVDGVQVKRLPISRYRYNLAVRAIVREARNADLIQTFNYHACAPAWLAGKITGKPVVCTILGLFGPQWRELKGRAAGIAFEFWEKTLLRLPYDTVVFISDFSKRNAPVQLPDDRTLVCTPGISLEHYYSGDKEDHVLFVGKVEARKGLESILEAARQLPHVPFKLVGWGEDIEVYRRVASPNVQIVEFERGQALYDAFAQARIFLFPSHAETFGLAAVEAMASGCAVISSVPLQFEGERIQAGNVPEIVAAVDRLWKDRRLTDAMGRANVQLAQQYTWDRHIETLWARYEEILDRRGRQSIRGGAVGEHS